jgi:hypothetical protein
MLTAALFLGTFSSTSPATAQSRAITLNALNGGIFSESCPLPSRRRELANAWRSKPGAILVRRLERRPNAQGWSRLLGGL